MTSGLIEKNGKKGERLDLAGETYYGHAGFYIDGQLEISRLNVDIFQSSFGVNGRAASLEIGRRFEVGQGWSITPQAQLSWTEGDFAQIRGAAGERVTLLNGDRSDLRLGISTEKAWSIAGGEAEAYGIVNVNKRLDGATSVDVSGVPLTADSTGWTGEVGFGATFTADGGKTNVFGEINAVRGLDNAGSNAISGTFGVRWSF